MLEIGTTFNFITLGEASPRVLAFTLLVAFFILTIALVPVEYRFLASAPRKLVPLTIILEVIVFILVVTSFLAFIFDWFVGIRGAKLLGVILILLWAFVIAFLFVRTVLNYQFAIEARKTSGISRKALEDIYQALKEKKESAINKDRYNDHLEDNSAPRENNRDKK